MALIRGLVFAIVPALAALATSFPVESALQEYNEKCETVLQRKAWHTLSNEEKKSYIDAELCLMSINATNGLPASRTKFDELQENHQIQANEVHGVGAFLPYHRYLMWAHEYLLRTECGYKGTQPYWYEQMDAGHFINSTVLDPVTGFGGDGRPSDGCITDGPFANYTNSVGPWWENTLHCIDRNVSDFASTFSRQSFVDNCNQFNDFERAWQCIEGAPHAGGHGGVGGQMQNPVSSPGDPLFYLHHTWLDKVWWDWQNLNISSRLYDISGRNVQDPRLPFPGAPGNGTGFPFPFPPGNGSGFPSFPSLPPRSLSKRDGDPGNVTTLDHVLNMMGIIPNATIRDVMDTRSGPLCYEYVQPEIDLL